MKSKYLFAVIFAILASLGSIQAQRAGRGSYEPRELELSGAQPDNTPVIARHHYLRIEVPKWFINNQGNFLKNKIVSGTVEIKIGDENYNAVLGTFPLSQNNKVSPVFNRALIDNRVYNGGDMTIKVFLKGIKRDTVMGGLLKSLADTALNVAVGQVTTMTGLGAVPSLGEASKKLTDGVRASLDQGEEPFAIFEENGGLESTFSKAKIATFGRETFWLAYKGDSLNAKQVKVVPDGQGSFDVYSDNGPLRQGAWVLFRITRESAYGNSRPWLAKAEQVRKDLDRLMQDWQLGAKNQQQVKTELTATLKGDQTADRILALRGLIQSDSVLSVTEQGLEVARLVTLLSLAQNAAEQANGYNSYFQEVDKFQAALTNGTVATSEIARSVVNEEFNLIAKQASNSATDEFVELLKANEEVSFYASTAIDVVVIDTSLLDAESQNRNASESNLKAYLKENADSVTRATSLSEIELWKRLGEIEREKKRATRQP